MPKKLFIALLALILVPAPAIAQKVSYDFDKSGSLDDLQDLRNEGRDQSRATSDRRPHCRRRLTRSLPPKA